MLYIVVALKSEAQAFVDFYELKKTKLRSYTLFSNDILTLIISGVGTDNARLATQTLLNHYDIEPEDVFLNVGVCAAPKKFSIGECLEIGAISYHDKNYTFAPDKILLECSDSACFEQKNLPLDMESYGFYDAVTHNPAIQHFYIYKIVSDHFQPNLLTKDGIKALVRQHLDTLALLQKEYQGVTNLHLRTSKRPPNS